MSTLLQDPQQSPLKSEGDLLHYFDHFAKMRECFRVGLEAEFFAVDRETGRALPYAGDIGVQALLKKLGEKAAYEPILEDGNIIALKKGDNFVTLEPGGQIELSAPPVRNVFEIEHQLNVFLDELTGLRAAFPSVTFLSAGIHPFSQIEDVTWVPKKRYAIMADYLGRQGSLAHHMMKLTCTNQINVDYLSEEHAMASLRTIFAITPIASAIFANSGFSGGAPNGYLSKRSVIWQNTDSARTGLLARFMEEGRHFRDYLDYALEMPVMFIVRAGKWIPVEGMTFRGFLKDGYSGTHATLGDFEVHLSTAFPEARIKKYLEIRSMDAQHPALIPAVAAFWKGILYDPQTRETAWDLFKDVPHEEILRLYREVPLTGFKTRTGASTVYELARSLVDLSCASLGRQVTPDETRSECLFLQRIRDWIIGPGRCPAETLIEKWEGELARDPRRLIHYLQVIPA